jgi:hypothetical protein
MTKKYSGTIRNRWKQRLKRTREISTNCAIPDCPGYDGKLSTAKRPDCLG